MGSEVVEGFVVDIACLRKHGAEGRADRAREHTRECALMGHCIESGYGLVRDDGRVELLEPDATGAVVRAVRSATREKGVRLRAEREEGDGARRTVHVEEVKRSVPLPGPGGSAPEP